MQACRTRTSLVATAALAAAGLSCGKDPARPADPSYNPQIPAVWAASVTHSYFPLVPGTSFEFEAQTPDGLETVLVEVLPGTRAVNGVAATVVRDRVSLDGVLIEDTHDWYAQDLQGNVWYLGEDSKTIDNGMVVSTAGSWEWNVDGALPGIIMWGDPVAHAGVTYRQEYYRGQAEDWARVVAAGQAVDVPYGSFTGCLQIEEWNGLHPEDRDHKYYAAGIGQLLGVPVAGGVRTELVRVNVP